MVKNEICEIREEIQRQPNGINILLETELAKLYSLQDDLYEALPLTGEQDTNYEEEKNDKLMDEKLEWYYNNQAVLYSGDRFLLDRGLDHLKLLRAEEKRILVD